MATKKRIRKRRQDDRGLLTEVLIGGKLAGAVIWSRDRRTSVFVEEQDFRYFGDYFIRLYRAYPVRSQLTIHTPRGRGGAGENPENGTPVSPRYRGLGRPQSLAGRKVYAGTRLALGEGAHQRA
ncbi:MAG: hypothetical protein AMXMBFR56_61880 [Polyangiaceae bacterium]